MEGCQNIDLEFEADSLININQLSENGDDLHDLEAVLNAPKGASPSFGTDANVGLPQLHESRDPEPTKRNGRYNLRKSLAWDSAFFTNAGVLDQEELSTMITGTNEAEKHLLPRIEEDITGSTESMSSLQSDHLTLDSHDDDLFLDIRASIQRSTKKASIFTNSTCKKPEAEVDNQAISSLEKEDLVPQCKNSKLASKKTSGPQAVRTLKCQPKQNTGKPGSERALKQDSVQSQMTQVKSTAKIGQSTSVLRKPPKAIAKTIPNSTSTVKRGTMSAVTNSGVGSLKPAAMFSSKGTQPPKAPVITSAGRVFSKPAGSSKSSSVGSSTSSMVQSSRLSTSSDSSSSISSKTPAKSLLVTTKRNALKSSNAVTGPSGSVTKTPSRVAVKTRLSSKLSAFVKSTKTSTSVSPASSISDWSSVSSTSSMVNPRSNKSRTSLDASSCKSMDSDTILPDLKNHFASPSVDGRNKEIALPGNNLKKASAQTGSLQAPMKPSGLRLPSPNFGYFAGVNSRTPNKPPQSQSGSRTVFSKSEAAATPNRNSNIKLKSSNVSTPTTATASVNAKPALSKATPFALRKEKSHASGNEALVFVDIDDAPGMSVEAKDNAKGQNYHGAGEVEVVAEKQVIDAVMSAIDENLCDLKKEMEQNNMEFGVMNIATSAGNNASGLEYTGQRGGGNALGLGGGDAFVSQNHLENYFYQLSEGSDKENGQVMYRGEGVKGYDGNVKPSSSIPIHEALSEILENVISFPAKASKYSSNQPPLAVEIFSSSEECINLSKESENRLSVEAKDNAKGQIYHKADEVEVVAGKQVIDAVMSAINEKLSDWKKETNQNNMELGVLNIATLAGSNASDLKYTALEGGGDASISQNHLENIIYEISVGNESRDKENGQLIYQGEGIKEYNRNLNVSLSCPMHEVLGDILENVVSFPAKASSPNRTLLALNNISSNEECMNMSKESDTQPDDMEASTLP